MPVPRTWNLRMNLDEFNALVSSLFADDARALALQGLSLGCNRGPCPDGAPDPFRRAWEIGSGWRSEAECFIEKKKDAGSASAKARREKYGSSQPLARTGYEHRSSTVLGVLEQGTNQSPIPNPQSSIPKPTARKAKPQESLDEILGDKKESYWNLVSVFGPTKNPAPKTTARLYVTALASFSGEHIQKKAEALLQGGTDPKYLPQLAKWLEGEGYRNPDQPRRRLPLSGNSRAQEADAAFLEQLERMDENPSLEEVS